MIAKRPVFLITNNTTIRMIEFVNKARW